MKVTGLIISGVMVLLLGWMLSRQIFNRAHHSTWSRYFATPLAGVAATPTMVYATDQAGGLWLIQPKTGETYAYTFLGEGTVHSPLLISPQLLTYVGYQGSLITLATDTLSEVWRFETNQFAEPNFPHLQDEYLIVTDRRSRVYVLQSSTGTLVWSQQLPVKAATTVGEIQPITPLSLYTTRNKVYVGDEQAHTLYQCELRFGNCRVFASDFSAQKAAPGITESVITHYTPAGTFVIKNSTTGQLLGTYLPSAEPFFTNNTLILPLGHQFGIYQSGDTFAIHPNPDLNHYLHTFQSVEHDQYVGTTATSAWQTTVFLISETTNQLHWNTVLPQPCSQPTIIDSLVIVPCQHGKIYGLAKETGAIQWELPILGTPSRITEHTYQGKRFALLESTSLSQDNYLYGVDPFTGTILWQSPLLAGSLPIPTAPELGSLYLIDNQHQLVSVNQHIPTFAWPAPIRTTPAPNPQAVPNQGSTDICPASQQEQLPWRIKLARWRSIFRPTFTAESTTVTETASEPALELTITSKNITSVTARFWQNSDEVEKRTGFRTKAGEFKVRFLPPETGTWFWEVTVNTTQTQNQKFRGSSKQLQHSQADMLHIKNNEWYRNDTIFHGIGWQTCMLDTDFNSNWNEYWPINPLTQPTTEGEKTPVFSMPTYVENMQTAGFNVMRLSLENCSPRITQCLNSTGLVVDQQTSLAVDETLRTARLHNMAVVFGIFGFEPWHAGVSGTKLSPQLAQYLDYVINRYGAYVDVWELANESSPSPEWIQAVSEYLRQNDPYQHPITTSWERPDLSAIDITQIHYYHSEKLSDTAQFFLTALSQAKQWSKPVIIGETGNSQQNFDAESLLRFSHKNWLSVFSGTPIIWWEYSTSTLQHDFSANIFVGPLEKQSVNRLRQFTTTYLHQPVLRRFVITNQTNVPVWLGIETPTHNLLYPTNPFDGIDAAAVAALPTQPPNLSVLTIATGETQSISSASVLTGPNWNQPFVLLLPKQ